MPDNEPKDNLLDILREAGYDAYEFAPGETLSEFLIRTQHQQPEN